MTAPFVEIFVGPPGVGKSTYARTVYPNFPIVSTDDIIQGIADQNGLSYNDVWQDHIKSAEEQFFAQIEYYLHSGISFIVDRTNLNVKARNRILDRVRCFNKKVQAQEKFEFRATVFTGHDLSMREWLEQLDRPGKTIPINVLINMVKSMEDPKPEEGFSEVTYINGRDY